MQNWLLVLHAESSASVPTYTCVLSRVRAKTIIIPDARTVELGSSTPVHVPRYSLRHRPRGKGKEEHGSTAAWFEANPGTAILPRPIFLLVDLRYFRDKSQYKNGGRGQMTSPCPTWTFWRQTQLTSVTFNCHSQSDLILFFASCAMWTTSRRPKVALNLGLSVSVEYILSLGKQYFLEFFHWWW